jgi:acylphosphatase
MASIAVDVRIHGTVQGVALRWHAAEEARRLGVTGWVRNELDGSVAGHFEGEQDAVDSLVAWCRQAPRPARIDRVDVGESTLTGARSFEITG